MDFQEISSVYTQNSENGSEKSHHKMLMGNFTYDNSDGNLNQTYCDYLVEFGLFQFLSFYLVC